MHQNKYIKSLLDKFQKNNIRPSKTPYAIGQKLIKSDQEVEHKK